ncbi:MAG: ribosome maturation factor RimM [Chloroflexi bacterium]|nr:ribosome maturation factor RimM [Chloroflexota bacterium]
MAKPKSERTEAQRRQLSRRQPDQEKLDYLIVGEIVGTFGIHGEIKARILSEFPNRFKTLETVYVGGEHRPHRVEGVRYHKGHVILKLEGYDDPERAGELRGALLFVPVEEAVPLEQDQYYHYQVVGLDVWTETGQFIGRVVEVLTSAANDVFVVQGNGKEILIPAIKEVVKKVDPDARRLEIRPLPGLLEGEEDEGTE